MRILHTSDWHLGHTLHDQSREYEHELFLAWLLERLGEERADALLVAGDVFDAANPPATAQAHFYRFLAQARGRYPSLDVVIVGGNHDSAQRLDAPDPILREMDIRVVGGMRDDAADLVFPLTGADGLVAAWVAAVPFLRTTDLSLDAQDADPQVEGVRRLYATALDAARARREPGQALLATGHCYMVGTAVSELSERKILGGNQHALPADVFPDDVAYAALGHLHLAQTVGRREGVRYSGSPIPLAMSEIRYPHQVCVADLDGERLVSVRAVPVPRFVEMLRVPEEGAAPLEAILPVLAQFPDGDDKGDPRWPFLEIHVALPRPDATLRGSIDAALKGKAVRPLGILTHYPGDGEALGDSLSGVSLLDLVPEAVFAQAYRKKHDDDPPAGLLAAFHELLETVQQEGAA